MTNENHTGLMSLTETYKYGYFPIFVYDATLDQTSTPSTIYLLENTDINTYSFLSLAKETHSIPSPLSTYINQFK